MIDPLRRMITMVLHVKKNKKKLMEQNLCPMHQMGTYGVPLHLKEMIHAEKMQKVLSNYDMTESQ